MTEFACGRCGKSYARTAENFAPDSRKADKMRNTCRICIRESNKRSEKLRRAAIAPILVLSDVHHPEHDRKVWATILELAKDVQPSEVMLLGDFLEMASVSAHGGAELEKLTEDFMAGKKALRELREVVGPDCRITYLEGNHESRLTRFLMMKAPSLRDSLSYDVGLELQALDVDWVPEHKQPVSRGDVDFTHGHQDLRERPSKFHSGKMVDVYGRPERTVIYGHTHKPQMFTRPTVGGYAMAFGLGCARTLMPGWLHGQQAGWVHQIALVYLTPAGRGYVYPITFRHGQAVWNGRLYGAVSSSDR